MGLIICPQRQSILDEVGPVLVTGGPGSGKTTIALLKAKQVIELGLTLGQSILFLSFSRSAVMRLTEDSKLHIPKTLQNKISIQTFHSFFWEILKAYGYLLGAPKTLRLLLPHDEKAKRNQAHTLGNHWEAECKRLFYEEGIVPFDLFSVKAHELLLRSKRLCTLFSARHPMIIVDEAQDTAEEQWRCVQLLSIKSQLVCLADLDQQIYDFRPGVSSERVTHIMESLKPLRVDLQSQNYRSPNSEIVTFANDILLNSPRGTPYQGVSSLKFRPDRDHRDIAVRQAIGLARQRARAATGQDIENIAVLATWRAGVNIISRALTGNGANKTIQHRMLTDEAPALLSRRFIVYLLEPRRSETEALLDLAEGLELAATVFYAFDSKGNLKKAQGLSSAALQCRAGKAPRSNTIAAKLLVVLNALRIYKFSGEPRQDWIDIQLMLVNMHTQPLKFIAQNAEQLNNFPSGQYIAAGFVGLWQAQGNYYGARSSFDAALAEEALLSGYDNSRGIHVMTIHKSKGKEFDAVILLDDSNNSPLVYCSEEHPYPRSRRLLRVGITRARHHVLMLTNFFKPSIMLSGHKL